MGGVGFLEVVLLEAAVVLAGAVAAVVTLPLLLAAACKTKVFDFSRDIVCHKLLKEMERGSMSGHIPGNHHSYRLQEGLACLH